METPKLDCYGLSDMGRQRETNQDQFLIAELNRSLLIRQSSIVQDDPMRVFGGLQGLLLLVADGMGGMAGGERASGIAVQVVTDYVLNTMRWFYGMSAYREDELVDDLRHVLQKCRESIQAVSDREQEFHHVGTTLTMAYILWPLLVVVHAGDSRCYLVRNRTLSQITKDHTMAQQFVDEGVMDSREAEQTRFSSVVTNVLGGGMDDVQPAVYKMELEKGDALLLCSDGLTQHVPDNRIYEILSSSLSAKGACREFVDAGNAAGGTDNITVVVARAP